MIFLIQEIYSVKGFKGWSLMAMRIIEDYSNQNETEVSATLVCCRVVEKHAEEFVTMS